VRVCSPQAERGRKCESPIQAQQTPSAFICKHNKMLSVGTMRVCNPERSPVGINRRDIAPTPSGFAEIVSDYFPSISPLS
jgi:hypothetical protein